ncbi:MAG: integrase [Candidatus Bathyarchaeia archaeon]
MDVDKLIRAYQIAEKIIAGVSLEEVVPEKPVVWNGSVREEFLKFMRVNGRSQRYIRDCVLYLNTYVTEIREPKDVVEAFEKCKRGKNHLYKALSNLLRFYEVIENYPKPFLDKLREAMPKVKSNIDYTESTEEEVVETFKSLKNCHLKYRVFYQLVLESGARPEHLLHMINNFNVGNLKEVNGFCRYTLGLEKGTKHHFYVYMKRETADALVNLCVSRDVLGREALKSFVRRHLELVKPKLLRKFAYNRMVLSGIPESVADFINGRKPRTIGGQHYMWLKAQADSFYPKYLSYLEELSKKIG